MLGAPGAEWQGVALSSAEVQDAIEEFRKLGQERLLHGDTDAAEGYEKVARAFEEHLKENDGVVAFGMEPTQATMDEEFTHHRQIRFDLSERLVSAMSVDPVVSAFRYELRALGYPEDYVMDDKNLVGEATAKAYANDPDIPWWRNAPRRIILERYAAELRKDGIDPETIIPTRRN